MYGDPPRSPVTAPSASSPAKAQHGLDATASAPSAETGIAYLALKADDRQELRLPALLKEHAGRLATLHGQSTSQYLVGIIAAHVSQEIAAASTWSLSAPEVMTFLQTMMAPPPETDAMREARELATRFFGPPPTR